MIFEISFLLARGEEAGMARKRKEHETLFN